MAQPPDQYHIKTYNLRVSRKRLSGEEEVLMHVGGHHGRSFTLDPLPNAKVEVSVDIGFKTETHLFAHIEITEL